ncbi:peptidase C26 [Pirellula staleyi DSM 6068]|uniref:Peptidase C26 n=1 Tax=Pirellula staleyi (strain ATCC 27377 / DSM 6068 / ICPB 4128) TaxID=530564 RepID=D2R7S7_PIRSD|nr:gamma-glutamyl-gamma-aminobutyrate hydrolase family protein [Pirellula staleyi]ADB17503.1 peptidase C26 [Pirellula staleyi DSM 6068]
MLSQIFRKLPQFARENTSVVQGYHLLLKGTQMPAKPIIAMNADFRATRKEGPALTYIAAGYYDKIIAAGGIPLILPPNDCEADILSVLDLVDGLVLVGGGDLDPRRDGFQLHSSVRPMDSRREDFDRLLVGLAAERRLPIFGIGCGMQLLNLSQGGNLYLHVPEDLPDSIPHRDPQDPEHRHGLQVVMGSLMERVYGDGEIRVNSMHHMAVDEVARGFTVTARCPDGVIEAIESTQEDWFAIGTQFHPESDSASALDVRIFEEFIAGVISHSRSPRLVAQ